MDESRATEVALSVGVVEITVVGTYLSHAQPIDFEHVFDFEMHVSPHAFPELHHLQQLALSVIDSSTDPEHTASSA